MGNKPACFFLQNCFEMIAFHNLIPQDVPSFLSNNFNMLYILTEKFSAYIFTMWIFGD